MDNDNQQRVLARVKRIRAVRAHPNADLVAIATVDGWEVVVGKAIQANDLGVYFEIDSVLPRDAPWVAASGLGDVKTIKTKKIRGVLSQGLFVPMATLPPECAALAEDDDVTKLLGVTKASDDVHAVASASGKGKKKDLADKATTAAAAAAAAARPFAAVLPHGPPKTDELRVQSYLALPAALVGLPYVATLKYDGTSATYFFDTATETLCMLSRNLLVTDPTTVYALAATKYALCECLARRPDVVIQGEVYGPGVNGNRLGVRELSFAVFDVYDRERRTYLGFDDARAVCAELGLPAAAVVYEGDSFPEDWSVADLLAKAEGVYDGTQFPREGLVYRARNNVYTTDKFHNSIRLSFKVINNEYLLAIHK